MSAKQRILVLCNQAPWLRNGGSMLRNAWMIDALAKAYTVDLVVADEPGPIPASFAALLDHYACFPRRDADRAGSGRTLRALRPGQSSLTAGWTSPELREHVAERLGRFSYLALQLDLQMMGALPRLDAIPIVYNAHNCESALLARRARTESPHLAAMLAIDSHRVQRQERELIRRATLVAACSEQDLADFERFAPGVRAKSALVPNGVDVRTYRAIDHAHAEPRTVLITGSMDWRPNILGLRWFLREVLEPLRAHVPDVVVRVAGRMQPDLVAELATYPNVQCVPNPVSMEPHLAAATVVAAPIVASSGTRLRILEAWAANRPVVTTTAGALGLECRHGRELFVSDVGREFARALENLLESERLRTWVTTHAAEAVTTYDWQRIGSLLRDAYEPIAGDVPRRYVPTVSGEVVGISATI